MLIRICRDLFPLASLVEQERYLVHATAENYLLPEELLETAFHIIGSVEENAPWVSGISEQDKFVVAKFGTVLKSEANKIDLDHLAWADLVYDCPAWADIRQAAHDCILSLGCTELAEGQTGIMLKIVENRGGNK